MAPRKDDEEPNVMGRVNDPPSPSSPTSLLSNHLEKSLSLDVLDLSYPMEDDIDLSRLSLTSSFERLTDRYYALRQKVEASDKSIIVDACLRSLCSDFSSMLTEARLLLENMGTGGNCFLTMITPWRVSLSQLRALSYLDTIETALDYPSLDTLDSELCVIWDSMTTSDAQGQKTPDADDAFRISPWTMPSLSFDLMVGSPVSHTLRPSSSMDPSQCLPLKVNIWAIVELLASDIAKGKTTGREYPACAVSVERCIHETHKCGSGAGILGDAFVRVKLSPFAVGLCETAKRWGLDSDADSVMQVKEARCVQVNAFPPKPQANVDLFTTSVYGERGIGMSLCFQTFKTLDDEVPEVDLELVVG